jgi:hypothetical protein
MLGRNNLEEDAIIVTLRLMSRNKPMVDADQRIREEWLFFVGTTGGIGVTARFQEVELSFEKPYQVGVIRIHGSIQQRG